MKFSAFILVLFLIPQGVESWADTSDLYASLSQAMSLFIDPHTGLTIIPTLLIPLGGRYEGMGTAYTAMAQDSGFIESNPSASSLLRNTELAFYHHNWISDSNLEGVVYTVRFNELGIGIGGKFLYVPFTAYDTWGIGKGADYISESVATLNLSYNFFQSYYFYGVAVGSNLKIAFRSIPEVFSAKQSSLAFMTDIGAQTSFNFLKFYSSRDKNLSIGATMKNLGLSSLPGEQLPLMATVGFAYSPLRPWTIDCDFNYPFSLDPAHYPATSPNVALGMNVNVASFISIQAGALFQMSKPKLSLGTTIDLGEVSFVANYNLDLSSQLDPFDKFSVQAQINLGDFGRAAAQDKVEQLYLAGVEEYANGNYAKAIEYWKQVLEIDPKYVPAREYIDTVQRTIDLQNELESHGRQ